MAAAAPHHPSAEITPEFVANEFIKTYYDVLRKHPKYTHKFYKEDSIVMIAEYKKDGPCRERVPATTLEGIQERVNVTIAGAVVNIVSREVTPSKENSVLLQVTGTMTLAAGKGDAKFAQTFFLAPQDNGYYVLNDILTLFEVEKEVVETVKPMENGFVQPSGGARAVEVPKAQPLPIVDPATQQYVPVHIKPPGALPTEARGPSPARQAPPQAVPEVTPVSRPALAPEAPVKPPSPAPYPTEVQAPVTVQIPREAPPAATKAPEPPPALIPPPAPVPTSAPAQPAAQPVAPPPQPRQPAPAVSATSAPPPRPAPQAAPAEIPATPPAAAAPAQPEAPLSYAERVKRGMMKGTSSPSPTPQPVKPAPPQVAAPAVAAPCAAPAAVTTSAVEPQVMDKTGSADGESGEDDGGVIGVYLKSFAKAVTEEEIRAELSKFGEVTKVSIQNRREADTNNGYVDFAERAVMVKALGQEVMLGGKPVKLLERTRPTGSRGSRLGGGGRFPRSGSGSFSRGGFAGDRERPRAGGRGERMDRGEGGGPRGGDGERRMGQRGPQGSRGPREGGRGGGRGEGGRREMDRREERR